MNVGIIELVYMLDWMGHFMSYVFYPLLSDTTKNHNKITLKMVTSINHCKIILNVYKIAIKIIIS